MKMKHYKFAVTFLILIFITSISFSQKKTWIELEKFEDKRIEFSSFLIFGEFSRILSYSDKFIVGINEDEFGVFLDDRKLIEILGKDFIDTNNYEKVVMQFSPYKLKGEINHISFGQVHLELKLMHSKKGIVGSSNLSLPIDYYQYGDKEKEKIRSACFELIRGLDSELYKLKKGQLLEKAFGLNNDSEFNVLILPLLSIDGPTNQVAYHVKDGLNYLNDKSSLNINTYILEKYEPGLNLNLIALQKLIDYHNADMIIYGDYIVTSKVARLGFLVNSGNNYYSKELHQSHNFLSNINNFRTGRIDGNVDFIVYWIAGMADLNNFDFENAESKFNYIVDELGVNSSIVNQINIYENVISAFLRYGNHFKTSKFLNGFSEFLESHTHSPRDYSSFLQLSSQNELAKGNFSDGKDLALKALLILEKNNIINDELYLKILVTIQSALGYVGESKEAIIYGNLALQEISKVSKHEIDVYLESVVYSNLGAAFNSRGQFDDAQKHLENSINLQKSRKPLDSILLAINYANLGENFFLRQFNTFDSTAIPHTLKAESYFKQALGIINRNTHHSFSYRALYESNLGSIYIKKANLFPNESKHYLSKAVISYTTAIEIWENSNAESERLIKTYSDIATALILLKKFNDVEIYLKKFITLNEKLHLGLPDKMFPQYALVSALYLHTNNLDASLEYCRKAEDQFIHISKENDNYEYFTLVINQLKMKLGINEAPIDKKLKD